MSKAAPRITASVDASYSAYKSLEEIECKDDPCTPFSARTSVGPPTHCELRVADVELSPFLLFSLFVCLNILAGKN